MTKLAAVVWLSFLLTTCDLDESNNVVYQVIYNANKSRKAVLFLKVNGATSDNSLQVSILPANRGLDKGDVGNIFTVDSDHGSTIQNENSINVTWISNDTLMIRYDKRLRTFIKKLNFESTTIIYEASSTLYFPK